MNNVFDITLDTEIHPFKLNPQKYTDDFAKITQKFNLPTALAIANELISYIQNPENKVFVKAQYIIPLLSKLKTIEEGNYLVIVKEEMSPDGKTPKISLERKVAPITEFASSHTDYLVGNGITTP
jgi:hypothetical protein